MRDTRKFAAAGFLMCAVAAPWILPPYELNVLARCSALAILGLGLVLLWGEAGILSLGQGVFFGLGGYVLAMNLKQAALGPGEIPDFMVWSGLDALPGWWRPFANPAVALVGVALVPAAIAAAYSWLVFRRRVTGVYFALITQALALAFATLLISKQPFTGGFNGLTDFHTLLGFELSADKTVLVLYWITIGVLALAYVAVRALMRSRYGTLLRATRDGENRVRYLGYDPSPYRIVAFTVAAALAGVAGALFTLHSGVISPALVGVVPSIEMVVWVAVGGRNSLGGAIAGTVLVNFAKDKVSSALPELWPYVLGALFVVVVLLLPQGLVSLVPRWGRREHAPAALTSTAAPGPTIAPASTPVAKSASTAFTAPE